MDRLYLVNVTEVMIDAEPQEIIASDKLNAKVDAQVYFKFKRDEERVKNALYSVNSYQYQIVKLARTTLRDIIGTMTLTAADSERGKINHEPHRTLRRETARWGIDIVRTELKEIEPPKEVRAKILEAEGEAQAIKLVNESADKYFVGNARLLRRLIAVETALSSNAKIVVPANTELINVIGEMAGILPLRHSGT